MSLRSKDSVKFITVSGIDKSGKTTIINSFMEKTNYSNFLVDRDPTNFMALNAIQDRITSIEQAEEYYAFTRHFVEYVDLAVLLTCKVSSLEKRFKLNHEPDLVGHYSMDRHQKIILNYFERAEYPNQLIIDTTDKTVAQCVNLILNKLKE